MNPDTLDSARAVFGACVILFVSLLIVAGLCAVAYQAIGERRLRKMRRKYRDVLPAPQTLDYRNLAARRDWAARYGIRTERSWRA